MEKPQNAIDMRLSELVQFLQKQFNDGITRDLQWRKNQLLAMQKLLQDNNELLQRALRADLGKGHFEAAVHELALIEMELTTALKQLHKWVRPQKVATPLFLWPAKSSIHYQPRGVVIIYSAWNFPLLLALAPMIAAIAAGNCIVLKPSEKAPQCAKLLRKLIRSYLDPETIYVIPGSPKVASVLSLQPWDMIFFTGSSSVGRRIMLAAARNLTPTVLELGGKSPAIVCSDTNLTVAAKRIAWGKWLNAGQSCIAPDFVLIEEEVFEPFCLELMRATREFFHSNAFASPDYGRIISEEHLRKLIFMMRDESIIFGGDYDLPKRYLAPTIVAPARPGSRLLREEIFGPILPILRVANREQMQPLLRKYAHPLNLYIFSDDKHWGEQLAQSLRSGSVVFNDVGLHFINNRLPFGGIGHSGMGKYHGWHGFAAFSHQQAQLRRSFRFDQALRYPPYEGKLQKVLQLLRLPFW